MEYEQIKKLIDDMGNSKLTSINIDFPDGTKISMTKEESKTVALKEEVEANNIPRSEENEEKAEVQKVEEKNENAKIVKSPMVGTFYSKSSPTASSYVEIRKQSKGRRYTLYNRSNEINE